MKLILPSFCLALLAQPLFGQWKIEDNSPAQDPASPLVFERKSISRAGSTGFLSSKRVDLVWFHADKFTFKVVDNGPGPQPTYPTLAAAMKETNCLAGCNGGFFLKNHAPSGLMIADGASTGTFGTGGLLSGVILSSGNRNPYLLRRSEYGSKYKATDLIQAGPFLVDQGAAVAGLSPENSRRRTFILHDGGKWLALGLSDAFTLAELGQLLSTPEFSPLRKIHRALNLDGGTSSGLYVDTGPSNPPIQVEPFKVVRNFVGIVPRQ
tara:strand:- start:3065 stop:3862 length:798 start_codon:yes stop_codon:yes gene_type:complete